MVGDRNNNKWTKDEEDALLAGIAKHGAGKWKNILDDPDFVAQLHNRSNIQLKDKWRNMQKHGRPIQEVSKAKALKSASSSSQLVSNEPSPNSSSDMSNDSRCNGMVFEAISSINHENGSDLSGILSFIEERHEVPQNFRKLLSNSLRLLVSQEKLEKTLNRYKISTVKATTRILTPADSVVLSSTSKVTQDIYSEEEEEVAANKDAKRIKEFVEEIDEWREQPQNFREFVSETLTILTSQGKLEKELNRHRISELEEKVLEAAPEVVAMKLAESDNKSYIAAEAVKEEQQIQRLVDENDTMLQLCLEIHEQYSLGKEVLLR